MCIRDRSLAYLYHGSSSIPIEVTLAGFEMALKIALKEQLFLKRKTRLELLTNDQVQYLVNKLAVSVPPAII